MNTIHSLRVQHIRTHSDFTLVLSPDVTLITGPNGSGKTSLVEALYIALQGTSFKGSDSEVLRQDASWYRIDIGYDDGSQRVVKFDSVKPTGRKQFIVDGKTQYRLSPRYKYPVVLFEPNDLRLLTGSPTRRRQFIDRFISQLDIQYGVALRRYERALKQRNTLLKRAQVHEDDLFAWNVSLSEYGAYIVAQRQKFIQELNEQLGLTYKTIAYTSDNVAIRYSFSPHVSLQQRLLADLHASSEKDRLLGFTSTGPHRHDVLFDFNGSPALSVASRGETRSIVLALKFLEVAIIEKMTNQKPVILLDDVFSELDETRQNHLIDFTKQNQVIITSATGSHAVTTATTVKL